MSIGRRTKPVTANEFTCENFHASLLNRESFEKPTGSIRACFARPNESVGFPSSSTVRLGERLPKNLLAVSISFSVEELIDSVIALATAATNVVSLSVGHKST